MSQSRPARPVIAVRRQPWAEVDALVESRVPSGLDLRWLERDLAPADERGAIRDASALVGSWLGGWPYDRQAFADADQLRIVQLMSAGFDGLDLSLPASLGIPVANIGDANASTVAEHAFALMLSLLRKLPQQTALVAAGGWRPAPAALELRGKVLGVLGMGGIGVELARRASVFGMDVRYHSRTRRSPATEAGVGMRYADFDDLVAEADVLAVTIALAPETTGMIGARELAWMKRSAYLVNVSRGGIVDEAALVAALDAGEIAGAGLDVLAEEPPSAGHPLIGRSDVLITPHQAGISPDLWPRVVDLVWSNVQRALEGLPVDHQLA